MRDLLGIHNLCEFGSQVNIFLNFFKFFLSISLMVELRFIKAETFGSNPNIGTNLVLQFTIKIVRLQKPRLILRSLSLFYNKLRFK